MATDVDHQLHVRLLVGAGLATRAYLLHCRFFSSGLRHSNQDDVFFLRGGARSYGKTVPNVAMQEPIHLDNYKRLRVHGHNKYGIQIMMLDCILSDTELTNMVLS